MQQALAHINNKMRRIVESIAEGNTQWMYNAGRGTNIRRKLEGLAAETKSQQ